MKQMIIHIGLHKTGTSVIQKYLRINSPALRSAGFLYPGQRLAHHVIGWMCIGKELTQRNVTLESDELCQQINDSKCPNVIISTEALSTGKKIIAPVLKDYLNSELREPWNAKIIVYLRRQDRWLESRYMENIRRGLRIGSDSLGEYTFGEFIERHREIYQLDYCTKLEQWRESFGKENIVVRVYEKGQWSGGIAADFLRAAGIHNQENFTDLPKEVVHPSLTPDAIELIRLYNKYLGFSAGVRRGLRDVLVHVSSKKPFSSYAYLSSRDRFSLLKEYDDSNRKVAKEYLGREDGRLFYEEWPDPVRNDDGFPGFRLKEFFYGG